jgi:predicted ATPase
MDRELARQRLQRGVFVGRDGELQRLHDALKRAASGHPRLVLLHGEAGIGKTALAGQLIMLAEAEGWWCGRAQSLEPSLEPYAPWGTIVDAVTRGEDAEALRHRLGRLAHAVARLTPSGLGFGDDAAAGDEHRAEATATENRSLHLARCQGVAELLCDAARRAPVLVVLEDLHAADAPALQLLEHVAMHAGSARLLLVGTYRDDGSAAATGARTVGSRLPTGFCERIGVGGLRPDDVRAMLQQIAGQAPPSLEWLHAASGGNPLLLVLMLWDLLEAGGLVQDGSTGRSSLSPDDITIPDSAGSLLDRRLERLSEETRVVLQLAALYHSDFDLERLGRLDVLSRDQLAAGLDAALGTGLIDGTSPPGRFRFRHGVFRRVLHARIGIAGRARYHRLIGEALEARANLGDEGVLEAAVRWTLRAAELEWGRGNYQAAAQHGRSALALANGVAWCDDAWRLDVLTRRLEALGRAGKLGELRDATREAVPLARRSGPERLTDVALAAGSLVRGFGRLRYDAEAVALLDEALAAEPSDPSRRALLQARLAEELMMGGGAANARARQLIEAARSLLPSCSEPRVAAAVLRSLH